MKTLQRVCRSQWLAVIFTGAALAPLAAQQPGSPGNPAGKGNPSTPGGQIVPVVPSNDLQTARANAKAFAKSNRLKEAEDELTRHNKMPANTAEWHYETSQKLLDLAQQLAGDRNPSAVRGLAARSLDHLKEVSNRSIDARTRGKAKALEAVIQERMLGDPTAAIASYQAALQANPGDDGTKEALERLQRADAKLRARIQPKKK